MRTFLSLAGLEKHSFTECFPECLKFDGSVPLWTEHGLRDYSQGLEFRNPAAGACLPGANRRCHSADSLGYVLKTAVLNISFCILLRQCWEFVFLSGSFSCCHHRHPLLSSFRVAVAFLGFFYSQVSFHSVLVLQCFCSLWWQFYLLLQISLWCFGFMHYRSF